MALPDVDVASASEQDSQAKWFTPGRLLWLFCAMNMLVYLDRGASQLYDWLGALRAVHLTGKHAAVSRVPWGKG